MTRVRAVRLTALVPAFLLTPNSLPSASLIAIPVRVSLKRIRQTLAAPAQATANQGMHYSLHKDQMTNLTEKTTTTKLLNKLVTSKSNRHRNNGSRTISLNDIIGVRLSRGVTVTVVEDSIIGLVDPLPQNDIESLELNMNNEHTVEGARSIPIWIGMLAGTKQDILPIGLIISLV